MVQESTTNTTKNHLTTYDHWDQLPTLAHSKSVWTKVNIWRYVPTQATIVKNTTNTRAHMFLVLGERLSDTRRAKCSITPAGTKSIAPASRPCTPSQWPHITWRPRPRCSFNYWTHWDTHTTSSSPSVDTLTYLTQPNNYRRINAVHGKFRL